MDTSHVGLSTYFSWKANIHPETLKASLNKMYLFPCIQLWRVSTFTQTLYLNTILRHLTSLFNETLYFHPTMFQRQILFFVLYYTYLTALVTRSYFANSGAKCDQHINYVCIPIKTTSCISQT